MDEEQPQKKITLNNFFEQIVEVNKVANAALTNSNNLRSQLNAVQLDLKRLVESLQVNFDSGVQNVQTQINEVTNVIVDDQRIKQSETDALEQQIFAQEDKLQKQTKGQKAKPTSSDGNLLQRAASSIENKAKSNLLATGLYASSFLLAGLTGKKPESDYEKNRKRDRPKVKSDGNFFTNFFKRNDSKEDIKEKVIEKKITSNNITNNIENNNVIKKVIEEEKPNLVDKKKPVIKSEDEVSVVNTGEYGPDKDDKYVQAGDIAGIADGLSYNYLQQAKQLIYLRERKLRMAENNPKEKERHLKGAEKIRLKIIDFDKRFPQVTELLRGDDKKYYESMKSYSIEPKKQKIEGVTENNDLNLANNVTDGGTTIIEGGTEVVNENVNTGQKRGVVRVDSPKVKSSLSSVSVINIAEDNSVSNLSIS